MKHLMSMLFRCALDRAISTAAAAMEKNNEDANFQPQGVAGTLFANYRSRVELETSTLRLSYHPGKETPRERTNGVSRRRLDYFFYPSSGFSLHCGFHSSFSNPSRVKDNRHSFDVEA